MRFKNLHKTLVFAVFMSLSITHLWAQDGFEVPPKWAGAAAIITSQTSDFSYIPVNKGKEIAVKHTEKVTLLINGEKGASEFKFVYLPKMYDVEVEVNHDETGQSDNYDEGDAKDLGFRDNIPYFYKQLFRNFVDFEKINLGTLAKGDEISISYSYQETLESKAFLNGAMCQSFPMQVITYPTIYPKGSHVVTISMGEGMHMNYASMNGAPNANVESMLEADTTVIELKAGQSDPIARQYFAFPARMYATSRFEVLYCPKYKEGATAYLIGEPGTVNEEYGESDLKQVVYNKLDAWGDYSKLTKSFMAYLGDFKARGTDDWIKIVYRNLQCYVYNTGKVDVYNEDVFMGVFKDMLDEYEMEYDIVAGVDRHLTTIDDMVLNGDLHYGFRVKEKKEDYFVFPFTQFSSWNDKSPYMMGADAYLFTPGKKLEECVMEADELPMSLPADNQKVVRTNLKLGDGFTALIVNESVNYLGISKTDAAPYTVSIPEYHKAMFDKLKYNDYSDERDEDEAEEFKERRKNVYEADARSLFDTVEYQRFNVKTTGFEEDEDWLQINEKYTIPGSDVVKFQIKDSMRVYTVALGPFIETDYKISASTYQREGDVYVEYPRIIDFRVRFDIPDGYAVFGFEAFDAEFSTDFASFKSKAESKPNELEIKTTLVIKTTNISEGDWQQLATMLNKFEELAKVKITMAGN